jgi:phosphonate transport system permease protein
MTERRPMVLPADLAVLDNHSGLLRAQANARLQMALLACALIALAGLAIWRLDVSFWRIIMGLGELGTFVVLMLPPSAGSCANVPVYLHALAETVAIAFLGTLLAAIFAFPLGLLAARNVVPVRIFQFMTRRSLDTVRGIDTLIWALIWVNVVGLGPFAGVLAIMTSDIGTFGKLFSEAIEASDRKPVEGVTAVGGTRLHQIRFGILPQVLPVMLSQVLYYFESNTRSATIIGIVGAGGIGLHLVEQIRTFEWDRVAFLILLILAAVAAIDWLSARLRYAIIGKSAVAL